MRRPRLLGGLYLGTIMLEGYVNAGRIDRARELFDGTPMENVVSWIFMVSASLVLPGWR